MDQLVPNKKEPLPQAGSRIFNLEISSGNKKFACPQPGQAGTKKELACPGNYKLQNTNYKLRVSCGQI
jgi:hypothetical protein